MAEKKPEEKKSSRQQISKLIGINLSVSRVRKHVDKCNVNADIESACTELKALLEQEKGGKKVDLKKISKETASLIDKAYETIYDVRKAKHDAMKKKLTGSKNAADIKKLKDLEVFTNKTGKLSEKIEYVSKLRCRFSNDASVVLSSVLDYVVQNLVRVAMVNARTHGKAIIQVSHIVQGDFDKIEVYPLVRQLEAVQKAMRAGEEADEEEDIEGTEVVNAEADEEDDKNGSSFEFYVNLICKGVKDKLVESEEQYQPIRISKNIRKFCSDVVVQLIERISPLIKLYATTAKVKTVNDEVIKFVFKFLMLDAGGCPKEFCKFIEERLKIYKELKDRIK